MDSTTKEKALNLEDLQSGAKQILNKTFGNVGTCSTAAATAAKEITLGTTFNLEPGVTILVKFTNGISVANATLAVTHTPIGGSSTTETAKPIYLNGSALEADVIDAGASLILRYNGTQFDIVGGAGSGDKNAVLVGDYQGTATYPEFDPMLDTVHTKAQNLSTAQKDTAIANLFNKTYASGNGMGKVVLKKSASFASQVTQANTIYVIKYDFTLTADVAIPSGCVLQFEGGSISGAYTLSGNLTGINAGLEKIFGLDITIGGSWDIKGAYPEWFGAKADDTTTDNTAAIQKVLDTQAFRLMILAGSARYKVTDNNNDGYCLIMRNFTHIVSENRSEIVHFNDNTNPIIMKIAINWNGGFTEARGLRIKGIGFSNYDNNWDLECADSFVLYDFLLSDCGFYSAGAKCLKIADTAGYAHSVIRNCSFDGESQLFLYDRNIIQECFFSGSGCALNITSEYGCENNTIEKNTIVNYGGAITLTGIEGVRIINNQIEQGQDTASTHEKQCSIYVKGTNDCAASNILIKDNNLGGGLHLKRSIYIEKGVRVVLQDNRFGASCTDEDVYIDSTSNECIVRKNFKSGNTELVVTDSGYRTYGTKRKLTNMNTDGGVNPDLTFTLNEDGLLRFNGYMGNFVFGQGFLVGKFPAGYIPANGMYTCGNDTGTCKFKVIYDGSIIGVSYDGTNYNYTFPVFVVN